MLVRFWGTRGSLPTRLTADDVRGKIVAALMAAEGRGFGSEAEAAAFVDGELDFATRGTYGGASSCVEIEEAGEAFLVCDMGSGLREFGIDSLRRTAAGHPKVYNFFLSHLHWDHIMGFPFFPASFDPEAEIRIHGGHGELEQALRRQQERISFPVPFDWFRARFTFRTLEPGRDHDLDGTSVRLIRQYHDNDSYGFRFERNGTVVIYSTDSEHKSDNMDGEQAFVEFFQDADLVIFDTMYSLADTVSMKEDWGHSSNMVAVDLCHRAGARRLVLFHHEPIHDDQTIQRIHQDTLRYEELMRRDRPLEVLCAYDGLEIGL